jgi:hypothetical protein
MLWPIRDSADPVVTGAGQLLHLGRVHPHTAGHCGCCVVDSSHSGEAGSLNRLTIAGEITFRPTRPRGTLR